MREFLGFGPSLMVWEGSQCSIPVGVSELLRTSPSVVWKGSWGSIPRRVCVSSWDSVLVVGLGGFSVLHTCMREPLESQS